MIFISIKTTEIMVSTDQEGRMKVPVLTFISLIRTTAQQNVDQELFCLDFNHHLFLGDSLCVSFCYLSQKSGQNSDSKFSQVHQTHNRETGRPGGSPSAPGPSSLSWTIFRPSDV